MQQLHTQTHFKEWSDQLGVNPLMKWKMCHTKNLANKQNHNYTTIAFQQNRQTTM
jgi:hypothetical protein